MDDKRKSKDGAFPPGAMSYLLQAGWGPRRTVSTTLYERAFKLAGVPLLPKTKHFLREFGGLIIRYVTKTHQADVLDFLADRAVRGIHGAGLEGFEELIGVAPLCPLGHYLFGTCILFMDNAGRVYGGSDEAVTVIGRTGKEAVGNILIGAECHVIEAKPT